MLYKPNFFIYSSSRDSDKSGQGSDNLEYLFSNNFEDDEDGEEEPETQNKTISMQEYKNLLELIPKIQKLEKTVEKMSNVIKSKDLSLKIQRQSQINVSNLSTVSIYSYSF